MFAIIETGGKQYRVAEGDTIDVERLALSEGEKVTLERVLMVSGEDGVRVGRPLVEGARVEARVLGECRGRKLVVFKYKPKIRYRHKTGHRQTHTRLQIEHIVV